MEMLPFLAPLQFACFNQPCLHMNITEKLFVIMSQVLAVPEYLLFLDKVDLFIINIFIYIVAVLSNLNI